MKEIVRTLTQRGQVAIPVEVQRLLGVTPGDKVAFAIDEREVKLTSVRFTLESAYGSVEPPTRTEEFESISSEAKDDWL